MMVMVNYSKRAKKTPQKVHVNKTMQMEKSYSVPDHPKLSVDDREVRVTHVGVPPVHDSLDVVTDSVMDVLNDSVSRTQAIRSVARLSRKAQNGEVILMDSLRKDTASRGESHRPGKTHVTYAQDRRSTASSENSVEQYYTNSFGNEGQSRPTYTEEMEGFYEYRRAQEAKRRASREVDGGGRRELEADVESYRDDGYDGLDF